MLFWIIAGIITVACVALVALPLVRASRGVVAPGESDQEIYKARLDEIERDRSLGRLGEGEAELARAEEARRLIQSTQSRDLEPKTGLATKNVRLIALAMIVAIPLASLAIYSDTGNPQYEDQKLASRLEQNPEQQKMEVLLARAEGHLAENPNDAKGWEVLAPIYLRMGRYDDAVYAFENVIRLKGESPERLIWLVDALGRQAGGKLTNKSRDKIAQALKLDPSYGPARYLQAFSMLQDGRNNDAKMALEALIMDAEKNKSDPQLLAGAKSLLASIGQTGAMAENEKEQNTGANSGPTREEVEAASTMSATDRQEMIKGMVARLRDRLTENPEDKQGWRRLFRAYRVMGSGDDMVTAIADARKAFADDIEFLEEIAMIEAQMNKGARAANSAKGAGETSDTKSDKSAGDGK